MALVCIIWYGAVCQCHMYSCIHKYVMHVCTGISVKIDKLWDYCNLQIPQITTNLQFIHKMIYHFSHAKSDWITVTSLTVTLGD